ncbi:unnamed protein product [Tilletia caries]|uniref:C2H2-type domain-containing protein n=1 Tax=Tilletia caries TaxID=13290 RepID=A0ABN7J9M4_9BASI|nr:unnamed protein product [Tilletia caries]
MIASIKAGTTTAPPQRMRLLISFCIWSGYASSSEPARSSWAPIPELQGGKAAGYRGPLSAKTVTELLDTVLGKQAKRSLTGSRIGYVKYSHYIGWTAEHSQRGPKIDIPGRQMELWQCRICHTELQVLPKKLSNLGLHLYGNKVRGSCLKDNFSNCAEDVPEPDWSADGDPVPIGATSDRRRFAAHGSFCNPNAGAAHLPPVNEQRLRLRDRVSREQRGGNLFWRDGDQQLAEDFVGVLAAAPSAAGPDDWAYTLAAVDQVCGPLGVPWSPEKEQGFPGTVTFAGIQFDIAALEMFLSPTRTSAYLSDCRAWLGCSRHTKSQAERLLGWLQFACCVVLCGRPYLTGLIDFVALHSRSGQHRSSDLVARFSNARVRKDVR